MSNFKITVDAREYEPKLKHPTILDAFNSPGTGEIMELVNDHDPKPMHYQFMIEMPEQFKWDYLEERPEIWRVAITKKIE